MWKIRNDKLHGTDEKVTYQLKAEHYRTITKSMFHLQDRLEATDCQYMLQSLADMEDFLWTMSLAYIKTYLDIRYPFFKQGINNNQKNSIKSVRPLTSYFSRKTSISRSRLPPRFTSCYDRLKLDAKQKKRKVQVCKVRTLYEYFK